MQVPLVKQLTPYSCAAAALQAALLALGQEVSQESLMLLCGTQDEIGTSPSGIYAACGILEIPASVNTWCKLDDLASLLDCGYAVVTPIQLWGQTEFPNLRDCLFDSGHYIVICSIDAQNVYFMDPWVERYFKVSRSEFEIRWHNEFGNMYWEQLAVIVGPLSEQRTLASKTEKNDLGIQAKPLKAPLHVELSPELYREIAIRELGKQRPDIKWEDILPIISPVSQKS